MAEKVLFDNGRGIMLCGILSDRDCAKPIVVQCHGFSSSKDSPTYTAMERSLAREGIASFRFDFYGHGESQGLFRDITISEGVRDLEAAIAHVRGLGFRRIGLFGSSFGGMVPLLISPRHPEITAIAVRAPVSHDMAGIIAKKSGVTLQEWEENGLMPYLSGDGRRLPVSSGFLSDSGKWSVYEVAGGIRAKVLILHGDADASVPLGQSEKTASLINACTLKVIHGADHAFAGHEAEAIRLSTKFFNDELGRA